MATDPTSEESPKNTPGAQLKINVLLEEYKALRQEIIEHIRGRNYIVAITFAALIAGFFAKDVSIHRYVRGFIAVAIVNLISWYCYDQMFRAFNRRLIELENHVNRISDESLLQWESQWALQGEFSRPRVPKRALALHQRLGAWIRGS